MEALGYSFKDNGHWGERPAAWTDPDSALQEFLRRAMQGLSAAEDETGH